MIYKTYFAAFKLLLWMLYLLVSELIYGVIKLSLPPTDRVKCFRI